MEYGIQSAKLIEMLKKSHNNNLIRDFYAQFQILKNLRKDMICRALNFQPVDSFEHIGLVQMCDIRNIVVFLMWKEFRTVIDTKEHIFSSNSKLGTKIEDLTIYLETLYYVGKIKDMQNRVFETPVSYPSFVKQYLDEHGLVKTVNYFMTMLKA